jgi:hypothetical protein
VIRLSITVERRWLMSTAHQVLEYLKDCHNTESRAVKNRELRLLFNLTDRQVRGVVSQLRQEGEPVCSSSYGYWYSTDPDDIERTLHRLEAQVENMNISITGLKKALGR